MNSKPIYDVVLSFAGEDRDFVEPVAQALKDRGVSVFYDQFEQTRLWGKDLYEYLADLYMNRARFCVMFLSRHYASKPWPRHERRAAQARSFQTLSEYILPVRIDNADIPGILPTTGYISASSTTPEALAELILTKIREPEPHLDLTPIVWDWGDWIPYANEFISQNPVKGDELQQIMRRAGHEPPDFVGHGVEAVISFDIAEKYCELLGGRLPSVESIEYLSALDPPVLRAEAFERGWCSYEWTRSIPPGDNKHYRYAVQMTQASGGKFKYFGTVFAQPGEAFIGFRVAVLKPPKASVEN